MIATHSSALAWKIPWTWEPGGLKSMGSLGVGHNWATSLSLFPFMHWRRKWQSTPMFLPGESQGWGAWWAAVYGVAQSRTRLNRLSNSSSSRSNLASGSNHEDWRSVLQVDYIPHIFPSTDLKQLVHYFYRNIFNKSQVYSYNMLMIKFFARAPAYEKF